ncbi:MAG: rubrerythrin family protein [bacterium]
MIKNTNTEKNLLHAFAGESQARNRYTYYAGQARREGFVQIAAKFEEIASQEKEHAKRFFSFLEGGEVEISVSFPAGKIASTLENLQAAANGEHEEYSVLYPSFAQIARKEGFEEIVKLFELISIAEKQHESQFVVFAENIKNGHIFSRPVKVIWHCLNCGYTHEDFIAPKNCPACLHPQAFFEVLYV